LFVDKEILVRDQAKNKITTNQNGMNDAAAYPATAANAISRYTPINGTINRYLPAIHYMNSARNIATVNPTQNILFSGMKDCLYQMNILWIFLLMSSSTVNSLMRVMHCHY
jgi:hypothetical protein